MGFLGRQSYHVWVTIPLPLPCPCFYLVSLSMDWIVCHLPWGQDWAEVVSISILRASWIWWSRCCSTCWDLAVVCSSPCVLQVSSISFAERVSLCFVLNQKEVLNFIKCFYEAICISKADLYQQVDCISAAGPSSCACGNGDCSHSLIHLFSAVWRKNHLHQILVFPEYCGQWMQIQSSAWIWGGCGRENAVKIWTWDGCGASPPHVH